MKYNKTYLFKYQLHILFDFLMSYAIMKYIYLDTSHLLNWQAKKLNANEIKILNALSKHGGVKFVLSPNHIYEGSRRKDDKKIIAFADFLDKIPYVWIRNQNNLQEIEIKIALSKYTNTRTKISPFANDFIDTLEPNNDSLLGNIKWRSKTIRSVVENLIQNRPIWSTLNADLKNKLSVWLPDNQSKVKEFKNSEKWLDAIDKLFVNKLRITVRRLHIPDIDTEEFINFLVNDTNSIQGIKLIFYTLHVMLKKTQKNWGTNDIADLEHCSAAPFVDFISFDKQSLSYIKEACKLQNITIDARMECKIERLLAQ